MTTQSQGIKTIQIHAQTRYPIISAYEFEKLLESNEIQALLKPCTIYFMLQRPLLYFDNLRSEDGFITFSITDDSNHSPLECIFSPSENGFCDPDEKLVINAQFFKKTPDTKTPLNDVAAINLFTLNQDFLGWFSPNKFLYEVLDQKLKAKIVGNIADYLDFQVHYIGQSFKQDIWNRLTKHEKMQSILTREDSLNQRSFPVSFEISLLMLDIDGYSEANIFLPRFESALQPSVDPEDDERFDQYYAPKLAQNAPELTNEVEAMLVNTFKPKYNKILFNNYPKIEAGTRSAGYTQSTLILSKMPAILKTKHHEQGLILPV